jgi:Na+-driven multidrug efflux pump
VCLPLSDRRGMALFSQRSAKAPPLQQRNVIVAERRRRLLEGPIAPALISLALPIILGNALQSGYQLTDAFWVGRLGAPAVAAVAVSFPVTFLVPLGAGLAMAGATLIAKTCSRAAKNFCHPYLAPW